MIKSYRRIRLFLIQIKTVKHPPYLFKTGVLLLDYLLMAVPFSDEMFLCKKQNSLTLFSYHVIDKVTNIFYNKPMHSVIITQIMSRGLE